jgi:thioredoxin reductase
VYDVIIVGGGAAGLSAALVLGRARRPILIVDDGRPRNAAAEFSHGFLTRDGVRPSDLLRYARADIAAYPSVQFVHDAVTDAIKTEDGFDLTLANGSVVSARRLLLATGVTDDLPQIPGLAECWGASVFVCPFCDGWELRDRRLAVYATGREAVELAQELYGWTHEIIVCAQRDELTDRDRRWIEAAKVELRVGALAAIFVRAGETILTFEDGTEATCRALFISAPLRQQSPLFAALGCDIGTDGSVVVDENSHTSVSGCYAAGDSVTRRHQVLIAAASGAAAGITISCNLLESEAAEICAPIRGRRTKNHGR